MIFTELPRYRDKWYINGLLHEKCYRKERFREKYYKKRLFNEKFYIEGSISGKRRNICNQGLFRGFLKYRLMP